MKRVKQFIILNDRQSKELFETKKLVYNTDSLIIGDYYYIKESCVISPSMGTASVLNYAYPSTKHGMGNVYSLSKTYPASKMPLHAVRMIVKVTDNYLQLFAEKSQFIFNNFLYV